MYKFLSSMVVRPDKEISVSCNRSEIVGRVGKHIFLNNFFFLEKKIILCILKGEMPLIKMHKIIFFQKT